MKIPYSDARLSNGYNSAAADVKGSIGATDAWLGCFKERLRVRGGRLKPCIRAPHGE
jgi:hypothetical protein